METKTKLNQKNWNRAPIRLEKISDLTFEWSLYPRNEVDHKAVVENYAKALDAGAAFPTIKVGLYHGKKIIVDGVHRVNARKLRKIEFVDCSVLSFDNEAELFAEAVRLNSKHGKAFSKKEMKTNIAKLKKYKFDVKDIVLLTQVPANEFHRDMAPITELTGPGGRKIYCKIRKKKCVGEPNTREMIQFKNALMLIRDVANKGCVPNDEYFKTLVTQCRKALRNLEVNGYGIAA